MFSKDMLNPASPHFAFFAVPDPFEMVTPDNQLIFNCEANTVVDEGSTKKNLLPSKLIYEGCMMTLLKDKQDDAIRTFE